MNSIRNTCSVKGFFSHIIVAALFAFPGISTASLIWQLDIGNVNNDLNGSLTLNLSEAVGENDFNTAYTYVFNGSVFGQNAVFQGNQNTDLNASWSVNASTWELERFSFATPQSIISSGDDTLQADILVNYDPAVDSIFANSLCSDSGPNPIRCNGTSNSLTAAGSIGIVASSLEPTAIPEPSMAFLLGIGILGLVATRRKSA